MRFSILVTLAISLSGSLHAQRAEMVVRVQVTDSAGLAVANADVSLLHGLKSVVPSGPTDATGLRRFVVPRNGDELQIVARQIGYQRGGHFFLADRDSLSLVIRLRATPQQLAPVQVTAEMDLKQKRYHVTADDIAASKRPIADGLDVVTKLRPDMMDPPGQGIFARCGLYDVWINGRRIVFPPIDPALAIRTSQLRRAARSTANQAAGRPPNYQGLATVPVSVQSALAKIRPEHIEEMNYVDCRDTKSNQMARGQNAVFVVLKPGVGFDPVRGTYVLDAAALTAQAVADSTDAAERLSGRAPDSTTGFVQAYRRRLLGVFDALSGDPVSGAEVVDLATGTFARTSATGTVALGFLAEGPSKIQIRRDGYQLLELDVSISPHDTVPLTLMLTPKPK